MFPTAVAAWPLPSPPAAAQLIAAAVALLLLLPAPSPADAALARPAAKAGKLTLHAAGFFPVSSKVPEGAIGRGVIPAVELALQHINDSPKILRGIHLDLVYNDTQVRAVPCSCCLRSACRVRVSSSSASNKPVKTRDERRDKTRDETTRDALSRGEDRDERK